MFKKLVKGLCKLASVVRHNFGHDSLIRKKDYGEEVGEGGYVYAEPGVHRNVTLLDMASMHPSSICAENLFGDVEQFLD